MSYNCNQQILLRIENIDSLLLFCLQILVDSTALQVLELMQMHPKEKFRRVILTAPCKCTRGNAIYGGRSGIGVNDVRGTVVPSPKTYGVTLTRWGPVNLQVDANGSFVSNNNIYHN